MTKLTSANICQLSAIGQMNKEIGILTYKLRQDYLGEQRTLSLPPPIFQNANVCSRFSLSLFHMTISILLYYPILLIILLLYSGMEIIIVWQDNNPKTEDNQPLSITVAPGVLCCCHSAKEGGEWHSPKHQLHVERHVKSLFGDIILLFVAFALFLIFKSFVK